MQSRTSHAALSCALALLVGCPGTPRQAADTPATPPPATTPPAASSSVDGVATYFERIKMPPGAVLEVEAIDAADGTRVAATSVRDVAGPPIPFSLAIPRGRELTSIALRATLSGPDGVRWFETPAPVPVVPGDVMTLRMRHVAVPAPAPAAAIGNVAHWECGELGVMSRFDASPAQVRLAYNGTALALPLARSASGARYADATGNEFWTKGATGHLTLAGEAPRDCVQAAQPSPWNQALLRGVTFRAVGNEPGWSAEIAGTPPMLDAQLDYGERRMRTALHAVPGGFDGADAGHPVRVRIDRTPCADGMSGQRFEATVTLEALGRTYRGCGATLND